MVTRRRLTQAARWVAALVILVVAGEADAGADGFGPFPVRNFQPFQLLFLGMFGDRAEVVGKGALDVRVELAETSTVFNEQSADVNARVKVEQLRTGLYLRYGWLDRLEVGIEIPVLYRYRGFLGGAITATERATTGLAPARNALKGTGYAFNLSRDGQTVFGGGEGELGLGDITLISKYQFLSQSPRVPAVAVRFAVKVPSGDSSKVFGSGHADVGLGLAVEKSLATRWILYGNVNGIFPTGTVNGLTVQPAVSALTAAEYLWSPSVSFVAQFDYYSSPFHGTGTEILDDGVTAATVGFNYRLRKNLLWQVYGIENLDFITGSAADFTLSTLVTYRFGSY
jgi:hypothetical protein